MDMDQALQTFLAESRELLEGMETSLLGVLQMQDPHDEINSIFRAAHTIKGSAGLFALDHIVSFMHVVESVLDRVRDGVIALDEPLVTLLLRCGDHMGILVDETAGAPPPDEAMTQLAMPLLDDLKTYLGDFSPHAVTNDPAPGEAARHLPLPGSPKICGANHWHISARFGRDVLRNGMDPQSILNYLARLGSIKHIATVAERLPLLRDLNPEDCHLGFEMALTSQADKIAIEGAFEFVLDDCELTIVPPHSGVEAYAALIRHSDMEPARLGQLLLSCGTLTEQEVATALATLTQERAPFAEEAACSQGEISVEQGSTPAPWTETAVARQLEGKERRAPGGQSVRVDADKLDELIDLVGELITAGASATLAARRTRSIEAQEANALLAALVEKVRDSALQLRMVKIGGTFSRFRRVVHDVSRELGKDIELRLSGEDTELDKTVVEKIGDPLTHLVRNAMDHGIEPTDVRVARGKPPQGTVNLNAYHDSGSIVIEVSDDGGGLSRERIFAKALERGLVEPGRSLSDGELYPLIFEPGFSTAEQVTNLSGRGVGMDVVKRNIMALRGNVDITSQPGIGTTVTVRLPLTLAIINGFQVTVGDAVFVVPMEMIDECVSFLAPVDADYLDLRGSVLPFIRLRHHFDTGVRTASRENLVVVRHAGQKFGLVVDNLLGEAQTVIKPLSKLFASVRGISGSCILGNGAVALILDVPALIAGAERQRVSDTTRDDPIPNPTARVRSH